MTLYVTHIIRQLPDEYGYSKILYKQYTINNVQHKMISIIPLFAIDKISSVGLQFELTNNNLTFGSNISIRNYAIAKSINIEFIKGNGLIFISHHSYNKISL